MRRTGLAFVVAFGLLGLAAGTARADNCGDLQSRLAALDSADSAQWDAAGIPADAYAIERERLGVLKALAANRCANVEVRRTGRAARLLTGIFGKRPFRPGRFRDRSPGAELLAGGSYRTLCVRTCDGYYFPISFAAGNGELKRDEAACHALCPGQEVALYVQSSGRDGGPSVSLAGQSYATLPTAFRYRSEYDRACTCGPVDASVAAAFQAFSVAPPAGDFTVEAMAATVPGLPSPRGRPLADDPETLANRAGRFVPGAISPDPSPEVGTVYSRSPDGRIVRLVGDDVGYFAR